MAASGPTATRPAEQQCRLAASAHARSAPCACAPCALRMRCALVPPLAGGEPLFDAGPGQGAGPRPGFGALCAECARARCCRLGRSGDLRAILAAHSPRCVLSTFANPGPPPLPHPSRWADCGPASADTTCRGLLNHCLEGKYCGIELRPLAASTGHRWRQRPGRAVVGLAHPKQPGGSLHTPRT